MLSLAPIVPLVVTVLVLPPDEVIVKSSLEVPIIAPVTIAPPAEVNMVLLPKVTAPTVRASVDV